MEALEAGALCLLVDEDTSATNFMTRDHRMQELIPREREPITPFIDKVRLLATDHKVSTILVIGGSGDYFDVADTVIALNEYRVEDVTHRAKEIAERHRAKRKLEGGKAFGTLAFRCPDGRSIDPSQGKRAVKTGVRSVKEIEFGSHSIELGGLEQLVDPSQTRAIAAALVKLKDRMDGRTPIKSLIETLEREIDNGGLDRLSPRFPGDFARFRPQELAGAINRLRTLKVK